MRNLLILIGFAVGALGLSVLTPWGPCGPASLWGYLLIVVGVIGLLAAALILLITLAQTIARAMRARL